MVCWAEASSLLYQVVCGCIAFGLRTEAGPLSRRHGEVRANSLGVLPLLEHWNHTVRGCCRFGNERMFSSAVLFQLQPEGVYRYHPVRKTSLRGRVHPATLCSSRSLRHVSSSRLSHTIPPLSALSACCYALEPELSADGVSGL